MPNQPLFHAGDSWAGAQKSKSLLGSRAQSGEVKMKAPGDERVPWT